MRNGDERRFREILAGASLCSKPGASLVDKATFLARTARTAAIRDLAAHDVRVRVLGDIAAIHARTSHVAADGE